MNCDFLVGAVQILEDRVNEYSFDKNCGLPHRMAMRGNNKRPIPTERSIKYKNQSADSRIESVYDPWMNNETNEYEHGLGDACISL